MGTFVSNYLCGYSISMNKNVCRLDAEEADQSGNEGGADYGRGK